MKKLTVITHNGSVHSDELVAIALLNAFLVYNQGEATSIDVVRVPHLNNLEEIKNYYTGDYDYCLDVGKVYDGVKHFDHHQGKSDYSSAGLIWKYIKEKLSIYNEDEYADIKAIVDAVDKHDLGVKKSSAIELPRLIENFNNTNMSFNAILDIVQDIVLAALESDLDRWKDRGIVVDAEYIKGTNVKLLKQKVNKIVFNNEVLKSDIKAVVYPTDGGYAIQTINESLTSFNFIGPKIIDDGTLDFFHPGEFYAKNQTLEEIIIYAKKYFTNK